MEYNIFGSVLPGITITLNRGESVYTQSGAMVWMDESIKMESNLKGGIMKGIGRLFSGESLMLINFEATQPQSEVTFASSFPGEILDVELYKGDELIAQKSAFLCATQGISLSVAFTKKISSGFFGGEGFILQRLTGTGMVFLEVDGNVKERELRAGEVIKVDTGNIVAFESSVKYEIETVKGFKNLFFGGEGLFLTKLTGPGRVWLQTATLQNVAQTLIPYIPIPTSVD
ncbi:MAG: TIGR00266 family protein [Epulopiscium sp. Nuni2H_MBin003]|nr:MAG: TIGR00266 family protein [Epulopiscium sp. Nuni2H_MBin003]